MAQIDETTVEQLAARAEGSALVDVRMPDEYDEAHVPGAVLIPLPELPDRLSDIPAGSPLYVICKAGGRSLKAAEFLAGHGITAINVAGGTDAWIETGRPVATGDQPG